MGKGATNVRRQSNERYDISEFENLNLMFHVDHTLVAISKLDDGPFVKHPSEFRIVVNDPSVCEGARGCQSVDIVEMCACIIDERLDTLDLQF